MPRKVNCLRASTLARRWRPPRRRSAEQWFHHKRRVTPLLVLFALLAGGALAGILDAVVAIPLAGAVRVLVLRVLAPAVRCWSGAPVTAE